MNILSIDEHSPGGSKNVCILKTIKNAIIKREIIQRSKKNNKLSATSFDFHTSTSSSIKHSRCSKKSGVERTIILVTNYEEL